MIDTHTHLYSSSFGEGYEGAIERAIAAGVTMLLLPGVDLESIKSIKESHEKFPQNTITSMGLHPTDVKEDWKEVVEIMKKELESGSYSAVGEIGIDLHWEKENLEMQKEAFKEQLMLAEKLKLPVIIHSREAFPETLEIIKEVKPTVTLIFHSFTGDSTNVKEIREVCDPYFGINGVVTYKNAQYLRDALSNIGLDKIVLETDSPYLSPVPHRGEKNESSYICHVRDKIAEVLGLTPEKVERETDKNANLIFGR